MRRRSRSFCTNYRQTVREAAYAAAPKLGVDKLPAFDPEKSFTPWLESQIKNIADMAWPELPKDAVFAHFKGNKDQQSTSGWVLKDEADSWRLLTTFGETATLKKSDVKIEKRTLAEEAEDPSKHRTDGEKRDGLSKRGGLTGQFEPKFISAPEALVAAWSYVRSDKKTAALLLLPRIECDRRRPLAGHGGARRARARVPSTDAQFVLARPRLCTRD